MIKLQFLTMPGCPNCAEAKTVLEKVKKDFPELEIKELDISAPEAQTLVSRHQIMASPGIVINGELFSTGGLNEKKLREKLGELT